MGVRPPKDSRWPKGTSGNPAGPRPLLPEFRGIYKLQPDEVKRLISIYFRMTPAEILAQMNMPDSCSLQCLIGSTILQAIEKGDFSKVQPMLERVIGKVREEPIQVINYDSELEKVPPEDIISYLRAKKTGTPNAGD